MPDIRITATIATRVSGSVLKISQENTSISRYCVRARWVRSARPGTHLRCAFWRPLTVMSCLVTTALVWARLGIGTMIRHCLAKTRGLLPDRQPLSDLWRLGTVLATPMVHRGASLRPGVEAPLGLRNEARIRQLLSAFATLAGLGVMLLPGCIVPPTATTSPTPTVVQLQIDQNNADPDMATLFKFDRTNLSKVFSYTVVTSGLDPEGLQYFWYYDYDPQIPTAHATICPTKSNSCPWFPCDLSDKTNPDHVIMAVVSDKRLNDSNEPMQSPFDFPTGTHYDVVKWSISLTGACP